MKKLLPVLLLLLCCSFLELSAQSTQKPDKLLVSYEKLYSYSRDSIKRFWKKSGIPKMITPVKNAVDMYQVTYKGLWLDSSYIIAKGVLYVPVLEEPMAEMVYCHGTRISVKQNYGIQDLEQVVTMMHAADGYISYFPFYYGLGGGDKEHVYQHYWTEAMSVIHMIKAGRELLKEINVETTDQLFVTGYSQGGHAAMATHKMIETGRFPDVKITASSPMSGAYDMTGVQAETMFMDYDRPHYLPYLLISYEYAYDMWPTDIYSVFRPPFNEDFKEYFKQPRSVNYGYLDKILPREPHKMVIDSLVSVFKSDPNFIFTRKLEENNLYNWKPEAPMQLCACYGDNEVLWQNTEVAYGYMKGRGAPVYKRLFGKNLAHNPCAPYSIIYTRQFFDRIRSGKLKHPARMPFGKKLLVGIGVSLDNRKGRKSLKKTGEVVEGAMDRRTKKK